MPVYLDCNATTPPDERVIETISAHMRDNWGNPGSRTHATGSSAKSAVSQARKYIAELAECRDGEVFFTSGATESNNLALLGLVEGSDDGRRHIVTTPVEHSSVLKPLERLETLGFEIDYVPVGSSGRVHPADVADAVRDDTLFVSVMHVNNETGIIQPVREIADAIAERDAWFHVDAAQGFGKRPEDLRHPGIELISISSHKMHGPKGVGALIARRRGFSKPPVGCLLLGGGQEGGLRPGTVPTALVAGFGEAVHLVSEERVEWLEACDSFKTQVVEALSPLDPVWVGDPDHRIENTVCVSFPGIDSEALIVALKALLEISNGSACHSSKYEPSHVLQAMGLPAEVARGAVRLSWCHRTPDVDWDPVVEAVKRLQ